MAKVIKYTKAFKKQFKKRRQDPKWRSIFKSSLPQSKAESLEIYYSVFN